MPPRWSLPGELATLGDSTDAMPPRTVRDWIVDTVLFVAALVYWAVQSQIPPYYADELPDWMLTADPWVGLVACLSLWWRRRFPLAVALGAFPAFLLADTASGAAVVAIFSVAVRRRWTTAAVVTLPYVVSAGLFTYTNPPDGQSPITATTTAVLMFAAPLAFGVAVRSRRQVMVSLRRDVERQRREHELRLADARRAERERLAREMHDVLAHRISLVSMHAGALAYRTEQSGKGVGNALRVEEVAEALAAIRENTERALVELGEVLQVLRDDDADTRGSTGALVHLDQLVEDARSAGQPVTFRPGEVTKAAETVKPHVQRTAYRIVQEGLTNARKHAPGEEVTVALSGEPGGELQVAVTNRHDHRGGTVPGSGVGLVGLSERVRLDGGCLEHGVRDGEFRLLARLPWAHDGLGRDSDSRAAGG